MHMVSGGLLKFGRLNRFPSKYMFERARVSSLSFSSTAFTLKAKLLESFPRSLSPSIKTLALGLDINTHSIGFSVADPDLGMVIELGCFEPSRETHIFNKTRFVASCFQEIKQKYAEKYGSNLQWLIGVETALLNFGSSHYRQQDLCTLIQINSLISFQACEIFLGPSSAIEKNLIQVYPNSVRPFFGIKNTKFEVDAQLFLDEKASKKVPTSDVETKGKGNPEEGDRAIEVEASGILYFHSKKYTNSIKQRVFEYSSRFLVPNVEWLVGSRSKNLSEVNYDACDSALTALFACQKAKERLVIDKARDDLGKDQTSKSERVQQELYLEKIEKYLVSIRKTTKRISINPDLCQLSLFVEPPN